MKHILVLIQMIIVISCSQTQPRQNADYFSGENLLETVTAKEIREYLTQKGSLGVAGYNATVYPITKLYIRKKEQTFGQKNNLSKETINNNIINKLKKYSMNKFCFNFKISTTVDNEEHVNFKSWTAILHDSKGIEHKIEWAPETLTNNPLPKEIPSYYGKKNSWSNEGYGCTDIFTYNDGLKIKLTPTLVQWPLKDSMNIDWEFAEYKIVEGKKIQIINKKKNSQPYRNW